MAVAVASVGALSSFNGAISKPSGSGSHLIVICTAHFYDTNSVASVSGQSGWTAIRVATDDTIATLLYKYADLSTEPSSYTIALSGSGGDVIGRAFALSGVDASTPLQASGGTSTDTNVVGNCDVSATTDRAGCVGVIACASWNANVWNNKNPSGWTNRSGAGGEEAGSYTQAFASGSASASASFSDSNDLAAVLAIFQPAAGGGGDVTQGITGRSVSVAESAGTLAVAVSVGVSGQAASVAESAGTIAPLVTQTPTGQSASVVEAAGTISPQVSVSPTGQSVGVAESAGAMVPSVSNVLGGQAASITVTTGALVPSVTPTVSGQVANVAEAAGSIVPTVTIALAGQSINVLTAAGDISPSTGGTTRELVGQQIAAALAQGNLSPAVTIALVGQALGAALSAGSVGRDLAVPVSGRGLAITTSAGTIETNQAAVQTELGSLGRTVSSFSVRMGKITAREID